MKAVYTAKKGRVSPPIPTAEPGRYLRLPAGRPVDIDGVTAAAIRSNPGLARHIEIQAPEDDQ